MMHARMALPAHGDQVLLGVLTGMTAKLFVVDLQVRHRAAQLTPPAEPDRLALKQIDHDFARMYELFSGRVAVVVPATMRVLISGILITDVAIWIPRIDCRLELSDPTGDSFYPDLMDRLLYDTRTKLLNDLLTSEMPLLPRQVQGVIVAEGWADVPLELPDETHVRVELALRDQRRNEFRFDFGVRVNLSLKHKYERLQREHHDRLRLTKRAGLCEGGHLGDQKSVSLEEAINLRDASGEGDRELHRPN